MFLRARMTAYPSNEGVNDRAPAEAGTVGGQLW
jgi:hypothetical protein